MKHMISTGDVGIEDVTQDTSKIKSSVKSYVLGPSTKCYFNEFLFKRGP